jgi:hypothetical protein
VGSTESGGAQERVFETLMRQSECFAELLKDFTFNRGAIYFIGCSHMRHLANSFVHLLSPHTCNPSTMQKPMWENIDPSPLHPFCKECVCEFEGVFYIRSLFPDDFVRQNKTAVINLEYYKNDRRLLRQHTLQMCSHIFVNYGQWPAGGVEMKGNEARGWNLSTYRRGIRQLVHNLVLLRQHSPELAVTYLATNPHPLYMKDGSKMTLCPPKDWRFPQGMSRSFPIADIEVCIRQQTTLAYLNSGMGRP